MEDVFEGKTVLLTGGTGSFGQRFTEIVLKNYNAKSIRIYSRGEHKQVDMQRRITDGRLRFFVGDVRDKNRLHRAMNGVDIVIHAAALKHVPVCEYNPIEAVRTNIDGAVNIIDAAIDNGVEKVVALSTDKAVQPVNLYGATKTVAEKLFIQGNSYSGDRRTKFSCVRYGNVIGSNGSIVPLFMDQRKKGEITITDARMTRFWITLAQGVDLVVKCLREMKGGEIFIPKIPSTKITDLADAIAPKAKKKMIGIRPGEKLHEVLLTSEEATHTKEFESYYVVEPELPFWNENYHSQGKRCKEGFHYTSENNTWWLNQAQIKDLLVKEGWQL